MIMPDDKSENLSQHTDEQLIALLQETLKSNAALTVAVEELTDQVKAMVPEGDFEGHRRYHESLIELNRRRAKIMDSIIDKTLTALIWSLILWLIWSAKGWLIQIVQEGQRK